jgi:hypothetical protein
MAQRQISLDSSHTESPPVDRYAWVILFVVFLVSVAAPLNMSKVPPGTGSFRSVYSHLLPRFLSGSVEDAGISFHSTFQAGHRNTLDEIAL